MLKHNKVNKWVGPFYLKLAVEPIPHSTHKPSLNMGCAHTQAASEGLVEAFCSAVRLQVAVQAGQTHFEAECDECFSRGAPICCLECDFVGCPKHANHHHDLGYVFTGRELGLLWCFKCHDVCVDPKFMGKAHACIVGARRSLDPTYNAKEQTSAQTPEQRVFAHKIENSTAIGEQKQPFHAFEGLKGLVNMGATCYASAVLQSLVHNPFVRSYFLAGGHQKALCQRTSCLSCGVDQLFNDFFGSSNVLGYGVTDMLVSLAEKQPVMGAGSTEQDAHEFYLMLLNEFHNASHASDPVLHSALGERSDDALKCGCIAHRSFSGSMESLLECKCGYKTVRCEPTVDLGVNLPIGAQRLALEECLQRFTAAEQVANYMCNQCGQQNTTVKQLHVAQPPPVLLVQLKRFKHMGSKGSSKLDTPVDFSLELDLAPFMAKSPPGGLFYELYGVINHIGTLDTGHYTCMMKHSSGQWFEFDDAVVTAVDVETVLKTPRAYLLCYVVRQAL